MKKVISFTLATLASAALSFSALANDPCAVEPMDIAADYGHGFAIELNGFFTEFGNSGSDYLRLRPNGGALTFLM